MDKNVRTASDSPDTAPTTEQCNGESREQSAPPHPLMANAIRALAMDAVQQASSGHPGLPMGAADIATVLFTRFLKYDSRCPDWPDRDRFILSAGHGSMLLYALLHLTGYAAMPLEALRTFRQWDSPAAGHPEYDVTAGIEITTGPLGQGLASAVGMALGERMLNAHFGDDLVEHFTYVLTSDGDLMEGISHEAISLAGHLGLSRLIVLYDSNNISIDGTLDLAESGDPALRFKSAGWDVLSIDGHDPEAIAQAITASQKSAHPSLVICRTIIGYGSPAKQGTAASHGVPLGAEEIAATRKALNWPSKPFEIPNDVLDEWRLSGLRGRRLRAAWQERLKRAPEELSRHFMERLAGTLPKEPWDLLEDYRKELVKDQPALATRVASGQILDQLAPVLPAMVGGSADLTGSNNVRAGTQTAINAQDFSGSFIHYGIREHAMAATMNGLALHGGFIPYGGTFLVFSDYSRPSLRLAALMGLRVIHVMTHDSIGLGEDGPTHQPVEHLASLRAIPNLLVFRPADGTETVECWDIALRQKSTPSVMALSRQAVPHGRRNVAQENQCVRGAYEIAGADGAAEVTLLATGTEVSLALEARRLLHADDHPTRVVSMPCLDLFEQQPAKWREEMLGPGTIRIAIEAAIRQGWDRYIGPEGYFIGMEGFGASAPANELYNRFGITAEAVAEAARNRLRRRR